MQVVDQRASSGALDPDLHLCNNTVRHFSDAPPQSNDHFQDAPRTTSDNNIAPGRVKTGQLALSRDYRFVFSFDQHAQQAILSDSRPAFASVLPFARNPDNPQDVFFLLGKEQARSHSRHSSNKWCEFGGSLLAGESVTAGAQREAHEESLALLDQITMRANAHTTITTIPVSLVHPRRFPYRQYITHLCEVPLDADLPDLFHRRRDLLIELGRASHRFHHARDALTANAALFPGAVLDAAGNLVGHLVLEHDAALSSSSLSSSHTSSHAGLVVSSSPMSSTPASSPALSDAGLHPVNFVAHGSNITSLVQSDESDPPTENHDDVDDFIPCRNGRKRSRSFRDVDSVSGGGVGGGGINTASGHIVGAKLHRTAQPPSSISSVERYPRACINPVATSPRTGSKNLAKPIVPILIPFTCC